MAPRPFERPTWFFVGAPSLVNACSHRVPEQKVLEALGPAAALPVSGGVWSPLPQVPSFPGCPTPDGACIHAGPDPGPSVWGHPSLRSMAPSVGMFWAPTVCSCLLCPMLGRRPRPVSCQAGAHPMAACPPPPPPPQPTPAQAVFLRGPGQRGWSVGGWRNGGPRVPSGLQGCFLSFFHRLRKALELTELSHLPPALGWPPEEITLCLFGHRCPEAP